MEAADGDGRVGGRRGSKGAASFLRPGDGGGVQRREGVAAMASGSRASRHAHTLPFLLAARGFTGGKRRPSWTAQGGQAGSATALDQEHGLVLEEERRREERDEGMEEKKRTWVLEESEGLGLRRKINKIGRAHV